LSVEVKGVASAFGGVGNGLDNGLQLVGREKPFLNVTASGGVVLEADGGRQTFLEAIVEREEIVEAVRQVAEAERIALNGILALVEETIWGYLLYGRAVIELVAVLVFGEETVADGSFGKIKLGIGLGKGNLYALEVIFEMDLLGGNSGQRKRRRIDGGKNGNLYVVIADFANRFSFTSFKNKVYLLIRAGGRRKDAGAGGFFRRLLRLRQVDGLKITAGDVDVGTGESG